MRTIKTQYFWILIGCLFLLSGPYLWYGNGPEISSPLVINELLAGNSAGLTDEDGEYVDWIEIYNRSPHRVNLAGWALTNDPGQPEKWPFPNMTLDSGAYLIVFASGKSRWGTDRPLHTNFRLSKMGEFVGLYSVLEDRIVDQVGTYPAQHDDIAYGRSPEADGLAYLSAPTPGKANSSVLALAENLAPGMTAPPPSIETLDTLEAEAPEAGPGLLPGGETPATTVSSRPAGFWAAVLGYQASSQPGSTSTAAAYEPPSSLRLTELMYNPPGGPVYEFIELTNAGDQPVDLVGASFTGIQYTFPFDTLPLGPDQSIVLARDAAAFAERYPNVTVSGVYEGELSNQGEQITLSDLAGRLLISVAYNDDEDGWPLSPDGLGDSLVLVDPSGDPNDPLSWRASAELYGSPKSTQTSVLAQRE